ncbi:MAG: manganese efflux pump MntP family protein [Bacilli bacterium]
MVQVVAMAVGLSMDACAVAASTGMCEANAAIKNKIKLSFSFGLFQAIMPLIGYFLAFSLKSWIINIDHWLAFGILTYLGISMFKEASKKDEECIVDAFSIKSIITKSIATSIDALAIGVSLASLNENIYLYSSIIGIITFIFSYCAFNLGCRLGHIFSSVALYIGGSILIIIGLKILLEHTLF